MKILNCCNIVTLENALGFRFKFKVGYSWANQRYMSWVEWGRKYYWLFHRWRYHLSLSISRGDSALGGPDGGSYPYSIWRFARWFKVPDLLCRLNCNCNFTRFIKLTTDRSFHHEENPVGRGRREYRFCSKQRAHSGHYLNLSFPCSNGSKAAWSGARFFKRLRLPDRERVLARLIPKKAALKRPQRSLRLRKNTASVMLTVSGSRLAGSTMDIPV